MYFMFMKCSLTSKSSIEKLWDKFQKLSWELLAGQHTTHSRISMASLFKAIVFDIGGVLIELVGVERMIEWSGHDLSIESLWGRWLASPAVRRFEGGGSTPEEFSAEMVEEFLLPVPAEQFLEEFALWPARAYPGAAELVASLASRYHLATLSNTNVVHWDRICSHLQFEEEFRSNFLSYRLGLLKPDREIFEHIIEALDCRPAEILFLDDNQLNVDAAASVGIVARKVFGTTEATTALNELGIDR